MAIVMTTRKKIVKKMKVEPIIVQHVQLIYDLANLLILIVCLYVCMFVYKEIKILFLQMKVSLTLLILIGAKSFFFKQYLPEKFGDE